MEFQNRLKAVRFLGNVAAATGVTLSTTSVNPVTSGNDFPEMVQGFSRMDVLVKVNTLGGGTTPTVVAEVKELFSDAGYIRTAIATSTTTGNSFISRDNSNWEMGKGLHKQVIITTTGSPTSVSVDVYLIFSNYQ